MFYDGYGLTKAVLEGRKTMTRRIIRNELLSETLAYIRRNINYDWDDDKIDAECDQYILYHSPYKLNEVVAVAQAYKDTCWTSPVLRLKDEPGWGNKMFVYAGLMPHQIRITNVRIEKLQDISDENCIKEGVQQQLIDIFTFDGWRFFTHTARDAFAALIDKVSGKGTWDRNPYVFVYEFELVK